ncbi:MAG TPA: NADH-quinone oxidoreductase subunit N [Spirochaetia bacterium]|nr:NADH-quinone oxidoreductase subunit N [Spirochaetia bacterium]
MGNHVIASLIPYLIVAGTSIIVMLMIAARRMYRASFWVTVAGLCASLYAMVTIQPVLVPGGPVAVLFAFDGASRFMGVLVLAVNILTVLISYRYFRDYQDRREEFHLLLLLETLGSLVLVASAHVISFLLGLELLSVPLYGLLGYLRDRDLPFEAATKYFVLTAGASAIIVFGFAIIYYQTGTMSLPVLAQKFATNLDPASAAGVALVLSGLAFKLAIFPFHMWAADVYQGSPLPSTLVIATASKIAVFAFLYRFLGPLLQSATGSHSGGSHTVYLAITVLAIGSMLGGNLLALRQTNIKRLLAYSSTANLGYLLVPLAVGSADSTRAAFFYLAVYAASNLGILAMLTLFSDATTETAELESYTGLLYRKPAVSFGFILMALSLAGLPLSAGFFGKLFLFETGIAGGRWLLTSVFVAASVIALSYYLRLVYVQISRREAAPTAAEPGSAPVLTTFAANPGALVAIAVAVLFVLAIGIFPETLLSLLRVLLKAS